MPFRKIGKNKYVSDKGTKFTEKQVALYYATDGFTKKPKSKMRKRRKTKRT